MHSFLKIPGFDDPICSPTNRGRGIAIYTALHLQATILEVDSNFEEHLWCNIQITKTHNVICGGIYRSPNSSKENNDLLIDLLQKVVSLKHDHIFVAGDFNLKEIDWAKLNVKGRDDSYQHKVFDGINDLFLSETVKQPTRFRGSNIPSCLDWVLTENPDCVENLTIESPLGPSDHAVIAYDYMCHIEKTLKDQNTAEAIIMVTMMQCERN